MIQLSPEQEERAQRLHRECFIWDFVPPGENVPLTAEEDKRLEDRLAGGRPLPAVMEEMWQQRIGRLAADAAFRERHAAFWRQAGVNCVCITLGGLDPRPGDVAPLYRDIAAWHRRIQVSGYLALVTGAAAAEAAWRQGKVGIVFGMQDTSMLPKDVSVLDTLHSLGVRVIQLTYNLRNFIGDGCTERTQAGLSYLGVEFVRRMNELGIVVDLSHCGDQTTVDAIQVSSRPVAVTHSFCRAVYDHPRGKRDEQLRLLAERGGYLGILAVPFFLSTERFPSLSLVLDHIDHAVRILGPDRVGIGTDWGAFGPDTPHAQRRAMLQAFTRMGFRPEHGVEVAALPEGAHFQEMKYYTDWPAITRGLVSRGYTDEQVRGILGWNWLSFLRRAGLP